MNDIKGYQEIQEIDNYTPSQEEYDTAIQDAQTIMRNMLKYGTIDKPKNLTNQDCSNCCGKCFVDDFECIDCEGTGWSGDI